MSQSETPPDHDLARIAYVKSISWKDDSEETVEELVAKGYELRPIGNHEIGKAWNLTGGLPSEIANLLDSMKVQWSSMDVVRIGIVGEQFAPAVLHIGITPRSLSVHDGLMAASKCQELLVQHGFIDVDVEISEVVHWPDFRNR
ncbi:hypothetical protein JVU11DRAFT_7068 [Chiua virens]|nr:hypothetical protein JVU11DRAFT_7068 [Chiua virens]